MKIAILSGTSAWGGAEVHTFGLANTLADRGHDVSVVALGHDVFKGRDRSPEVRFRIRTVGLPRPVERMTYAECATVLGGLAADVCVLAKWGLEVGSFRLDLAARRRFGRYIVIEHSSAEMPPKSSRRYLGGLLPGAGLWWYRRRLLWHLRSVASHLVVCVSNVTRRRLVRDYRVPRQKVLTVHNGIDTQTYQPGAASRAARRRAWGVPEGALVFGSVGRLHVEKGYDLAIDLFARLVASHPDRDLWLVLVGDGAERPALEQKARSLPCRERVIFPGFTDRPWEAYCGLDVFVLPSRDEALPLALLEAMACGCCPVAMAVGGVGEVLNDSRLGWLVPSADRTGFLAAMQAAADLPNPDRAEMGNRARRHVVSNFNAQRQFAALADVIERN
jgi:glycosyltransferase involved in cell wall biosynthesis